MPEIKDPRVLSGLRSVGGPAPQPVPFPGAGGNSVPLPPLAKSKGLADQKAEQQIVLDKNQDARSATQLQLAIDAANRAEGKYTQELESLKANGGVTTKEAEDVAANHVTMLTANNRIIQQALKKDKYADKPTILEKAAGLLGSEAKGWAQNPQRQVVDQAYGDIVDSVLYLATGAAYNKEQGEAKRDSYIPKWSDSNEARAAKKLRLQAQIEAAKVRAGPANVKVQNALNALNLDELYANPEERSDVNTPPKLEKQNLEISTDGKRMIPIPEEMQKDYLAALPKPGELTVEDYNRIRRDLDLKYKFSPGNYTDDNAKAVVEQYNKQGRMGRIPGPQVDMGLGEELLSAAGSSAVGTGAINFTNAMGLGLPELLAGEEGRNILDTTNRQSPNAAMIGEILGSVAPTVGLEGAIAKIGSKVLPNSVKYGSRARLGTDMIANALYGGERSAASAEEGERGDAFLRGAGWGAAGTAAGRAVTKGVRTLRSERTNEAIEKLGDTDMTTAQRLGWGGAEESAQGVPFAHGARAKSLESFNRNNSQRVLDRINGGKLPKEIPAGVDANNYVNQALNNKYNTIRPKIKGEMDEAYAKGVDAIAKKYIDTPGKAKLAKELTAIEKKFFPDGLSYDGNSFKDYNQMLREKAHDWLMEKGPADMSPSEIREMGRLAEKMRQQGKALIKRTQPELGKELDALDGAWAHQMRIENATNRGMSAGDGIYSPSQYLTSVKQLDGTKGHVAAARGRAFEQDYGRAGAEILGSTPVPEKLSPQATSSTALALGLGGWGTSGVVPAIVGTGATLAYTPGLKRLTQALLTGKRPEVIDNPLIDAGLANFIRAYKTRDLRKD